MINFDKILTSQEISEMNPEKIEFAKKEGQYHYNYLKNAYGPDYFKERLTGRARELAELGHKYRFEDEKTKELIAANIVFPSDVTFMKVLISKGITYGNLVAYSRIINVGKILTKLSNGTYETENIKDLTDTYGLGKLFFGVSSKDFDGPDFTIKSKKLDYLCYIIKKYFGIRDENLILAKVGEITALKKELYQEMEQGLENTPKIR